MHLVLDFLGDFLTISNGALCVNIVFSCLRNSLHRLISLGILSYPLGKLERCLRSLLLEF